jgi:hypothetical protein
MPSPAFEPSPSSNSPSPFDEDDDEDDQICRTFECGGLCLLTPTELANVRSTLVSGESIVLQSPLVESETEGWVIAALVILFFAVGLFYVYARILYSNERPRRHPHM